MKVGAFSARITETAQGATDAALAAAAAGGAGVMRRGSQTRVHLPGFFARLAEKLRGREQKLVRSTADFPLLLLSYPKGDEKRAVEISGIYAYLLPSLPAGVLDAYREALARLPAMVVVILRAFNPCGCLGHHHPPGTESRLARRLAADLNSAPAEIDLVWEAIRNWRPQPLSSLAVGEMEGRFAALHFAAALLAVLLHELEHSALPDKEERHVRDGSNAFYSRAMRALISREGGAGYGMSGA